MPQNPLHFHGEGLKPVPLVHQDFCMTYVRGRVRDGVKVGGSLTACNAIRKIDRQLSVLFAWKNYVSRRQLFNYTVISYYGITMTTIVLASGNQKKLRELQAMLAAKNVMFVPQTAQQIR